MGGGVDLLNKNRFLTRTSIFIINQSNLMTDNLVVQMCWWDNRAGPKPQQTVHIDNAHYEVVKVDLTTIPKNNHVHRYIITRNMKNQCCSVLGQRDPDLLSLILSVRRCLHLV